jgi:hypothetical protein
MSEEERRVRLRLSSDRRKALQQYDDLRRTGRLDSAVILCDMKDGSFQVLGQGMDLAQIAQSLVIAAQTIANAEQMRQQPPAQPTPPEPQRSTRNPPPGAPMHSIAGSWASLEAEIFDVDTSAIQRREMRRGFYAGAQALFSLMMAALDPGLEETEDDLQRMDRWAQELADFGAQVDAGHA